MSHHQQKWFGFMEGARAALLQGNSLEYKPTIQLVVEPSFDNHTFLQLQVNEESVSWHRKTWRKLDDRPKFADPIENLKYIGRTITPTIEQGRGEVSREVLLPIIAFINAMTIKPHFDQPGIVIDGTFYALTIGTASAHTTYKWHYSPGEWADLQKLANMVLELNQKLYQQ
ncbi:MAG: hypothetical protein ACJ751_21465 [Niastella sp.]|uniref:hypothetical protein n=1 Tax=Niastella sp. TaxID=1869183 RepID=UPI00389A43B6